MGEALSDIKLTSPPPQPHVNTVVTAMPGIGEDVLGGGEDVPGGGEHVPGGGEGSPPDDL